MKLWASKNKLVTFLVVLFLFGMSLNDIAYADPNDMIFDCYESDGCDEEESPLIPESDVDEPTNESNAWSYIRTLFAFVFVIGLLYGLLKFINKRNRSYNRNRLMKNMGGISLGQNKSIQLVVIGDAHYLIGVGDDIRLLKEITDPEELETLSSFYDEGQTDSAVGGLLGVLFSKLSKKEKVNPYHSEGDSDFNQLLNSRLNEMKKERKQQINRLTEKEHNEDE